MNLRQKLQLRARLLDGIRRFFAQRGVLEVSTPILSQAGNTDPNIDSFTTNYHGPISGGPATRWLRTSPEFFHKRLLAEGSGDIFEIAAVFRDGECGTRHNPEFTLLEWYRVGFDHQQLMDEVETLLFFIANLFDRPCVKCERLSYLQLFQQYAGVDALSASSSQVEIALADYSINLEDLNRDDLLDLIRTHIIEPQLRADQNLFVYDFPASQAALARISDTDSRVAQRFELYLGPREIANGYHELTNIQEQRRRFEADLVVRRGRGQTLPELDENLLNALPKMPACAGVALGVDRLLQWLINAESIDAVLVFPFAQA